MQLHRFLLCSTLGAAFLAGCSCSNPPDNGNGNGNGQHATGSSGSGNNGGPNGTPGVGTENPPYHPMTDVTGQYPGQSPNNVTSGAQDSNH